MLSSRVGPVAYTGKMRKGAGYILRVFLPINSFVMREMSIWDQGLIWWLTALETFGGKPCRKNGCYCRMSSELFKDLGICASLIHIFCWRCEHPESNHCLIITQILRTILSFQMSRNQHSPPPPPKKKRKKDDNMPMTNQLSAI